MIPSKRRWFLQPGWRLQSRPVEYADTVPPDILDALSGKIVDGHTNWRDYPTAEAAIRDLCSAWIKVHRKEVPA